MNSAIYAQQPISSFSAPSSACLGERLSLANTSQLAESYEWDFCEGDLYELPNAQTASTLSAAVNPKDMDIVKNGDKWYGFATSRSTNSILRIEFGFTPDNNLPLVTNLGNIGNGLSGPEQIKVINESGNWFALVVNGGSSTLMRLSFGPSLESVPTIELVLSDISTANSGMDVGISDNHVVAVITNSITRGVTIVTFGNSITNNPSPSDILSTSAPIAAASIEDITLARVDELWYGFLIASGSRTIYRLNFGPSLFSIPSFVLINGSTFAAEERPAGIKVSLEKAMFVGFVQTANGNLFRVEFGTTVTNSNPVFTKVGNLGTLANSVNFELIKENSRWYGFVIDVISRGLTRVTFPENCPSNQAISHQIEPYGINYTEPGTYFLSLIVENQSRNRDYSGMSITILNRESPEIEFSSQNVCVDHDVNFNSINNSGDVTNYAWSFGDATMSSLQDPTHQYATSGDYLILLNVSALNGCNNLVQHPVSIYNQPTANFNLPQVGTFCTNQSYTFDNTSTVDPGYPVTWQWSVNGIERSGAMDFEFTFDQPIQHDILLKASIPGCENNVVKSISSLSEGPAVDFEFDGHCQLNDVLFANASTGTITDYTWDFDDGGTSVMENPTNSFVSAGSFNVTLLANSSNGCQNTKTKPITIYSLPLPNFQLELPPFSCSGMPSQFADLTPNPTDSNITSWAWDFGDGGSAMNGSMLRNPTHVYTDAGQYGVKLIAETNYGCRDSLTKVVSIAQTPIVSITNTPACDDLPITFSTSAQNDLSSWSWQIGNAQFAIAEPIYVFNSPGSYLVNLNAVAKNNCVVTTNKNVVVPLGLSPNFTVDKNCIDQPTTFVDITTVIDDPVNQYEWVFGDSGVGVSSPVSHTYANTGSYNVALKVTTESGCIYSNVKTVTIGNPPQASFTAAPEVGVPPLMVTFSNTSFNATAYRWDFNDINNSISTAVSPQFTFQDFGDYIVDLTAFNAQNCSHTFSRIIKAQLPLIDVGLENLTISEDAGGLLKGQVVINNKGNFTLQNLDLTTDFSGIIIHQQVGTPIPPFSSILYPLDFKVSKSSLLKYVCLEAKLSGDINPADNTICFSIDNYVVILDPYPNPSSGLLNVDWISPAEVSTNLTVIDPLGKAVFNRDVLSSKGRNEALLNLEGLSQGIYYLLVRTGKTKEIKRFSISR